MIAIRAAQSTARHNARTKTSSLCRRRGQHRSIARRRGSLSAPCLRLEAPPWEAPISPAPQLPARISSQPSSHRRGLLRRLGSVPPRTSTRQRILSGCCANEMRVCAAPDIQGAISTGFENAQSVAHCDGAPTGRLCGRGSRSRGQLEPHLVHDHQFPDVVGGTRHMGPRPMPKMG